MANSAPQSPRTGSRLWNLKAVLTLFKGYVMGLDAKDIAGAMHRSEGCVLRKAARLGLSFKDPQKSRALQRPLRGHTKFLQHQCDCATIIARSRLTYRSPEDFPQLPIFPMFPLRGPWSTECRVLSPSTSSSSRSTSVTLSPSTLSITSTLVEEFDSPASTAPLLQPQPDSITIAMPTLMIDTSLQSAQTTIHCANEYSFNFNADPKLSQRRSIAAAGKVSHSSTVERCALLSPDLTLPFTGPPPTLGRLPRYYKAPVTH